MKTTPTGPPCRLCDYIETNRQKVASSKRLQEMSLLVAASDPDFRDEHRLLNTPYHCECGRD